MSLNYSDGTDNKGQDLIKKANSAFSDQERKNAECTWQKLAEYIIPSQNSQFQGDQSYGDRKDQRIYDITGIISCRDFAASLHSIITNPASKWSKIRFQQTELNDMDEANQWLSNAGNELFNSLTNSNFDSQIGTGYQSLGGFGTMVLLHDEVNVNGLYQGVNFSAWHLSEVAYRENHLGEVDTIYRKFKLTGKQALDMFSDKIPADVKTTLENRPDDKYEFVHGIYPRPKDQVSYGETSSEKRPFASCYVMCRGNKIVKEDGYYEFPVYVVRWLKLPGEQYGFGPGHAALNDVLTINSLKRQMLKGLARAVDPTFVTESNNVVVGDFRPGRMATVNNIQGFKEVTTTSRFDVAFMAEERLQNSIKSAFYIDKLMLPPRNETGEMTAYEIQQRLAQNQIVLGPPYSRINTECLIPLIMRQLNILMRAGVIPPIPQSVVAAAKGKVSGNRKSIELQISFVNSLARSQQLSELQNINSWVQETAGMAQVKPDVLDIINSDEVAEKTARIRDIPEELVNTTEEVKAIRTKRQEDMEKAKQLQAAQMIGGAAKDMSAVNKNMGG